VPVGHISIDTVASTTTPSLLLADPSAHRFHISAFYVSRAMHGDGIGGVVVREAEDMAVRVLGARVLTLDTLDKRVLLREEDGGFKGGRDLYRRFIGIEPPEVSFFAAAFLPFGE
jgi:GNAT superfamily N-acetyltransferase